MQDLRTMPVAAALAIAFGLACTGGIAPAGATDTGRAASPTAQPDRVASTAEPLTATLRKAALDLARAMAKKCARAPEMDELRGAFVEAGAGEPLVAGVFTRAAFDAARAACRTGPGVTLDEAWRTVEDDARARSAFGAWSDAEYDAALARVAAHLCAPAGGKQ